MRFAFSTVATPTWTLDRVARLARETGYAGVELRSLGPADPTLACDPCHTDPEKIAELFEDAGLDVASVATSLRYDQRVFPPVIGRATGDFDRPVRDTKAMIALARASGSRAVRVFPFELAPGETHQSGGRRIVQRLRAAAATARHTGVEILVENAGSFARGRDLADLLDRVGSTAVRACYAISTAASAAEHPIEGLSCLAPHLAQVRVADARSSRPVPIGEGEVPVEQVVRHLARDRFPGWVTVDWPRLWVPRLEEPEPVLTRSIQRLFAWSAPAYRYAVGA